LVADSTGLVGFEFGELAGGVVDGLAWRGLGLLGRGGKGLGGRNCGCGGFGVLSRGCLVWLGLR
jgi:hypothetical protein